MRIKNLTEETLTEAIDLANAVFSESERTEEPPNIVFPASLNYEGYKDFLLKVRIAELRYWVVVDEAGRVMGTIGLYCYEKDKEEAYWLG